MCARKVVPLERQAPAKEDLKSLEVVCKRQECGDPVAGRSGAVRYTKRRMNFVGFSGLTEHAIFKCPVCGRERKFTINALTGNIREAQVGLVLSACTEKVLFATLGRFLAALGMTRRP